MSNHSLWRVVTLLVLIWNTVSYGQLNKVVYWKLGEEQKDTRDGSDVNSVTDPAREDLKLDTIGQPVYSTNTSPQARYSRLSIRFDGKTSALTRKGIGKVIKDNFVAEAFVCAGTDEGFQVILQYGSGVHGWSLVRNNKGYQVLLGGVALVGWSGDIEAGKWVHLAIVRDSGITRFYVNGQPAGESSAALNDPGADTVFTLASDTDRQQFFAGHIDEVRICTFEPGKFDPVYLLLNDPEEKHVGGSDSLSQSAAYIIFDQQPQMKGMTFSQTGVVPETIQLPKGTQTAWVARQGSAKEVPWARSFLITITDPSLKQGQQPVVDIEIEYFQSFDAPVELRADTENGSRIVGSGWGRANGFKVLRATIDDAFFGSRNHNNKSTDLQTDGYDLRINSFGHDFAVRSVRLIAYDLKENPDLKRLIRFQGISTDNDLMIFSPGSTQKVRYQWRNLAVIPAALKYRHRVEDIHQKVVSEIQGDLTIPARATENLEIPIDTSGLNRGVYRTSLVVSDSKDQITFSRTGGFAVSDEVEIPRAKEGEFLYGLDIKLGPAYGSPRLLRWARFMGADIIRHGFGADNLDEIATYLPLYEKYGLQVMLMCDPPKDQTRRREQLPAKLDFLRAVASRFPQIRYYELGNEPDLTYFYPGPIENYVEDFHSMSQAITSTNPRAIVLNGGLSFAGNPAIERAKRFIELVNPDHLGAWSFHGHGPGARAEAEALNRIRDLVRARNKLRPFIDTESGVAAQTPEQEIVQARTVVQKMVYAQSEGMPFLMFFRLYMFEEAYGMLYSEIEPRPAVLAYSNLVRTLRGQAFERVLTGLPDGVKGYLFKSHNTSQKTAVFWNDSQSSQTVYLTLGAKPVTFHQIDLFGNSKPLEAASNHELAVQVSSDPLYVTWQGMPEEQLSVIPSIIQTNAPLVIRETGDDILTVHIQAPNQRAVKGKLHITAGPESGIQVEQPVISVQVSPGANQSMNIPVKVSSTNYSIQWPGQWTCFIDVSPEIDPKAITQIPPFLPGPKGRVDPKVTIPIQNKIDFEQLGGNMREKAVAIVMANIHSEQDQMIRVGSSSDWWMEWIVNGKTVYSTLDRGNGGGYNITDHSFDLPLKRGNNLVVIRQLSGSMGWKLLIGSPDDVKLANSDPQRNGIIFRLEQPGLPDQIVQASVRRIPPLRTWSSEDEIRKFQDWNMVQPDQILQDQLINHFAARPDASKWWQGPLDLSARLWIRQKNSDLVFVVAVADDNFQPGAPELSVGDSILIELSGTLQKSYRLGIIPSSNTEARILSQDGLEASCTLERAGGTTFYRVIISGSDLQEVRFFNLTVFDRDDVPSKQELTLSYPQRVIWQK